MPKFGNEPARALIVRNAAQIRELHSRIHALLPERNTSAGRARWEAACREFHAKYDLLSFPGGYSEGLARILRGDSDAVDAALCFLEVRPYFFRSQYMRTKLLRVLKRTALTAPQKARLQPILDMQRKPG